LTGHRLITQRLANLHGVGRQRQGMARLNKEKTVNSGNMIRVAAAATLCLLGTVSVRAQGATPAGAASAGKIGVLNVRQAIVTTAEG